ncbi:hypothetical protein WA158_002702 [Blastocystis sp. Blastoise]
MRIVLVIDQWDNVRHGVTVAARRTVEILRKHGHYVRVVATGLPEQDKYVVPEIDDIVQKASSQHALKYGYPDEAVLREAFVGADLVHFMIPYKLCAKGADIALEMHIPITGAFHVQPENITHHLNLYMFPFVAECIFEGFKYCYYNKFEFIHCPTEFIANELRRHNYDARLYVISNGVHECFKPHPEIKKPAEWADKFVVTMVGRYAHEKRQDVLIKAIKGSPIEDKIQLVFAGTGPLEEHYKKLAHGLKNPAHFSWYDRDGLVTLLNQSDLYIHCADAEIEAISAIEAISCGVVPVIAVSKKSATRQFALDQRSLFEHAQPHQLLEKITYWIEHPEELHAMKSEYTKEAEQYQLESCVYKLEGMFMDSIKYYNETVWCPKPVITETSGINVTGRYTA